MEGHFRLRLLIPKVVLSGQGESCARRGESCVGRERGLGWAGAKPRPYRARLVLVFLVKGSRGATSSILL